MTTNVTFHASRLDRAKGARIYTLNLFDELACHASGAGDLARLCALMAEGRLDGQIELEALTRSPARWHPPFAALALVLGWSKSPGGLHGANHRPGLRGSGRPIIQGRRDGMRRITRTRSLLLGAVVAASALAATGSGSAASAKTVNGTVGPGFTIGLTMQGKKVTRLKAGTAYRFVISDRSSTHNFHLSGPGFNRVLTNVDFKGTKSFLLRLRKGSYRFVCDPHSGSMRGGFRVS
jgi:plastocyanin